MGIHLTRRSVPASIALYTNPRDTALVTRGFVLAVFVCSCTGSIDRPVFVEGLETIGNGKAGQTIFNSKYEMSFARSGGGDTEIPLPISLKFGSQELLNTDHVCPQESGIGLSGVGFGFYPLGTFDGSTGVPVVDATNFSALAGPAIYKQVVSFTHGYECGGSQEFIARSEYTLFPSGRIHRDDTVVSSNQGAIENAMNGGSPCGACQPLGASDGWSFSSFWSFESITNVKVDGSAQQLIDPETGCVLAGGTTIGIRNVEGPGKRLVEDINLTGSHYVFDFRRNERNDLGQPGQAVDNEHAISKIVVSSGADGCDTVLAKLDDPPIEVNGTFLPASIDGIYQAANETNPFTISSNAIITHGIAVRLDMRGKEYITVTRTSGDDANMLPQVENGPDGKPQALLLWLDDGIPEGESYIVELE